MTGSLANFKIGHEPHDGPDANRSSTIKGDN